MIKYNLQFHFVFGVLAAILSSGCATVTHQGLPHHHGCCQPPATMTIQTGGGLRQLGVLTAPAARGLTLREAVLQSGGITPFDTSVIVPSNSSIAGAIGRETTASPEPKVKSSGAPLTVISPESIAAPPVVRPSETVSFAPSVNDEAISMLDEVFQDKPNVERLFGLTDEFFGTSFTPINSVAVLDYLGTAASRVYDQWAQPESPRPLVVDVNSSDYNEFITYLILGFQSMRGNNPEFADFAIQRFGEVKKLLDEARIVTSVPSRPVDGQQPAAARTGPPSQSHILHKEMQTFLIGLVRSARPQETLYFPTQLVYKSAIGDVQLADGDFIFAIPVDSTSLRFSTPIEAEFSVTVAGLAESDVAAIYPQQSMIRDVFALAASRLEFGEAGFGPEHVAVLTRAVSGRADTEVFYIPLGTADEPAEVGSKLVRDGQLRPGDSLLFTFASRSPLVINQLFDPLRQSLLDKRATLDRQIEQERLLFPLYGRFMAQARANWRFYTQPISQAAGLFGALGD